MGDVSGRGYFITGTDTGVGKTVVTCQLVRAWRDQGLDVAAYKPVCSGAEYREGAAPAEPRSTGAGQWPPHPGPLTHSGVLTDSRTARGGEGAERIAAPARPLPFWSDVEALYAATNATFPRERLCPQTFLAPLSPPAAAALEGREVDETLLVEGYRWLAERADMVLVEGAGGFYSPISANWLNADLAAQIGWPVLIVAPNRLGTINQTLLTIEAIRQRGLTVAGVILNHNSETGDLSATTNAAEIQQRGRVRIWDEIPFIPPAELQSRRLPESMVRELRNLGSAVDS